MYTRLVNVWNHYVEADRRQLPLFPEWERAQWMQPVPAIGDAALALLALALAGLAAVRLRARR